MGTYKLIKYYGKTNTVILNPASTLESLTPHSKMLCKYINFQNKLSHNYLINFYYL